MVCEADAEPGEADSSEVPKRGHEALSVPNVSPGTHEVEQFEDDALEYQGATRRQATADVLRVLVASGYAAVTTEIVHGWIGLGLREYACNLQGEDSWKRKDQSVYLVATLGATGQEGVTGTNALVHVVDFFSRNVFEGLQANADTVHPILQVDLIRFLYSFRNQLTNEQLVSVLPLVCQLGSCNCVTYAHVVTTIERILVIRRNSQLLQEALFATTASRLNVILGLMKKISSPEKIAENDYLMKFVMLVMLIARTTPVSIYRNLLQRLIGILGAIAKKSEQSKF
ncbi:hypothetical protein ACEPAG_7574 [Sanghuangporus baumii]